MLRHMNKENPMTQTRTQAQTRLRTKYGPWAVVTGASDGIGREIAVQLAEAGIHLVLIARRQTVLEQLASEIQNAHHVQTRVIAADLSNPRTVAEIGSSTQDLNVGLLIAAAGFGTSGAFRESQLETELNMIQVNCHAVVALTHHFTHRLMTRGCGGIVLLSSLVAFQGVPNAATYAATKAFVQSFAEGIHAELKTHGVDVLAVAPGPVQSGFATRANMQMGSTVTASDVARGTLNALGKRLTVRPGFLSGALEFALSFLPRSVRVRVMALVMGGMTQHQKPRSSKTGVDQTE
jgi:uncharacterized protein